MCCRNTFLKKRICFTCRLCVCRYKQKTHSRKYLVELCAISSTMWFLPHRLYLVLCKSVACADHYVFSHLFNLDRDWREQRLKERCAKDHLVPLNFTSFLLIDKMISTSCIFDSVVGCGSKKIHYYVFLLFLSSDALFYSVLFICFVLEGSNIFPCCSCFSMFLIKTPAIKE